MAEWPLETTPNSEKKIISSINSFWIKIKTLTKIKNFNTHHTFLMYFCIYYYTILTKIKIEFIRTVYKCQHKYSKAYLRHYLHKSITRCEYIKLSYHLVNSILLAEYLLDSILSVACKRVYKLIRYNKNQWINSSSCSCVSRGCDTCQLIKIKIHIKNCSKFVTHLQAIPFQTSDVTFYAWNFISIYILNKILFRANNSIYRTKFANHCSSTLRMK